MKQMCVYGCFCVRTNEFIVKHDRGLLSQMQIRITEGFFFFFPVAFMTSFFQGCTQMALSPVGPSSLHSVRRMATLLRDCSLKQSHHFFPSFLFPKYSAAALGPHIPCAMAVHEVKFS